MTRFKRWEPGPDKGPSQGLEPCDGKLSRTVLRGGGGREAVPLTRLTTRTDLSAAEVVYCANQRCDQENVIEELKNGVGALRVPLYELVSNWAYMVIAALAWNLKAWFALMMHHKAERARYLRMDFRHFVNAVMLLPCRIMRRSRSITIRLIGYQPTIDRLFGAWCTIERIGFT